MWFVVGDVKLLKCEYEICKYLLFGKIVFEVVVILGVCVVLVELYVKCVFVKFGVCIKCEFVVWGLVVVVFFVVGVYDDDVLLVILC